MPMQLPVKTVQWCWRRRDFHKKQESSGKRRRMQEKGVLQWKVNHMKEDQKAKKTEKKG